MNPEQLQTDFQKAKKSLNEELLKIYSVIANIKFILHCPLSYFQFSILKYFHPKKNHQISQNYFTLNDDNNKEKTSGSKKEDENQTRLMNDSQMKVVKTNLKAKKR